jgi:hypothetical protein
MTLHSCTDLPKPPGIWSMDCFVKATVIMNEDIVIMSRCIRGALAYHGRFVVDATMPMAVSSPFRLSLE